MLGRFFATYSGVKTCGSVNSSSTDLTAWSPYVLKPYVCPYGLWTVGGLLGVLALRNCQMEIKSYKMLEDMNIISIGNRLEVNIVNDRSGTRPSLIYQMNRYCQSTDLRYRIYTREYMVAPSLGTPSLNAQKRDTTDQDWVSCGYTKIE